MLRHMRTTINLPDGLILQAKKAALEEKTTLTEVIAKGKGKMPAFGAKLKPDEIKQLVAYIRSMPKK